MSVGPISPFDALAAPAENGGVLCVPPVGEWSALIERNRRHRLAVAPLAGDGLRREPPLLLTGHQPEFFHPGVWAKNVAAAQFAERFGMACGFLVVDNDAPDGTTLRWPEVVEGRLRAASLPLEWGGHGLTFEQQPERSDEHWREVWSQLPESVGSAGTSAISAFMGSFVGGPRASAADVDYVPRWMSGIAALDRALGVATPPMTRVSRLSEFGSAPGLSWGRFVGHLLSRAAEFAAAYNEALGEYRAARGIRGPRHPIPDLSVTPERVELPLWAVRDQFPRQRLHVVRGGGGVALLAGDARIGAFGDARISPDGRFGEWSIRPRALTLTLFARLFACDLFIHGLGGSNYDVITDGLIRRFYGVEPPEYACVTATLRLPLGRAAVSAAERFAAQRLLRDARFNPQRLLSVPPPADLLAARGAAVAESDRLRREQPRQHVARRRVYERLRSLDTAIRAVEPELERRARHEWVNMQQRMADQSVAQSREWFYGLYPVAMLRELAERLGTMGGP